MAQLNYTTAGTSGHDMRSLDFDTLLGGTPVSAFNPFVVQWMDSGAFLPRAALLGDDLVATVSGGALTELTGTRITQLSVFAGEYNVGLVGLDVSAEGFFDLVQAKDWRGLAEFVRQGDDRILGTANRDYLVGGDGDDIFIAGLGRDVMNGGRGNDTLIATEGHDVMTGGRGADAFEFAETPYVGEWDEIKVFASGVDNIWVHDTTFNHVGFGGFDGAALEAIHFGLGKQAKTAEQGLIYDRAKGFLYYDADGSGNQADRVLFAKLGAGTELTFHDLWVV
jgi:Ca2+-binding RTX toxin-like protein